VPRAGAQEAPALEIALDPGIRVTGEVGTTYVIESKTYLESDFWLTRGWIELATPTAQWMDPVPTDAPRRVYRAVKVTKPAVQTIANMVWVPPGRFTMGSPESEPARGENEGPQTQVTLTLRRRAYIRYMDDFVVWGESAADLRAVWREVQGFLPMNLEMASLINRDLRILRFKGAKRALVRGSLSSELRLELKGTVALNRTVFGMDFLGYRVFPHELRLARRSKVRFARKFRRYEAEWVAGRWTELQLQQRMQALVAFTLPACSGPWRRHVLDRFACLPRDEEVRLGTPCARRRQGVVANGLGPRDSRRQQLARLERQRQELPVRQPQQQQPGQPEHQPGVPGRAGPSSTGALDDVQADPAAILSPEHGVTGQTAVEQGPV
jgi:hypothetical protein